MVPGDLHGDAERAFNAADVDALVNLYEPSAQMMDEDGAVIGGSENIRSFYADLTELGGRISMTTRYAAEHGDIALLSNTWTLEINGAPVASSISAEVARRQPDGSWRYIIDNPYGGATPANNQNA